MAEKGPERGVVLVVEHDLPTRKTVAELLQQAGYAVVEAADGREAFQRLQREPRPCVILLDLLLPRMSGWKFREQQRSDPALADIPLVVLSTGALTIAEAQRFGADGYLVKPYDVRVLLETVASYCR